MKQASHIIAKVLKSSERILGIKTAYAHCDIPCGIYDPHQTQVAAHSIVRMVQLIQEAASKMDSNASMEERSKFISKVSRYTHVKEEHAELVKKEIRIIWGDYFKPEHLEKFPELHDLTWKIMKLASKARQEVDMQVSLDLLDSVDKFAEMFWKSKNVETIRKKAPYPTDKEIVVPKA